MARVSRKKFITDIAKKNNISIDEVEVVYEAILNEIYDVVSSGNTLILPGFGSFYLQKHKGHPVQFGVGKSEDYVVFKFSASGVLNKRYRDGFRLGDVRLDSVDEIKAAKSVS